MAGAIDGFPLLRALLPDILQVLLMAVCVRMGCIGYALLLRFAVPRPRPPQKVVLAPTVCQAPGSGVCKASTATVDSAESTDDDGWAEEDVSDDEDEDGEDVAGPKALGSGQAAVAASGIPAAPAARAEERPFNQGLALLEHYGAFGAPVGAWELGLSRGHRLESGQVPGAATRDAATPIPAVAARAEMDPGRALLEQYSVFGASPGAWVR